MKIGFIIFITALFGLSEVRAEPFSFSDTTKAEPSPKRYRMRLSTRLLSMGAFYYSGRIISKNPALDFFFVYERKHWAFSFFKAFDLYDHLTDNNFSLGLFYKTFKLGKRLSITPHVGFTLEQNRSFADRGSDATVIIITAFKINKNLAVDNSSFFSNLVLEPKTKDWVNRFRVLYTSRHLDMTLYAWHNNRVFDNTDYFSSGFNITYARIKISKNLLLSTGITGLTMLHTSDESLYPKRNGVVVSISATID